MSTDTTTDDAAETLRYVYIPWPRCPACNSRDLQTLRSEDQGDDSTCRTTLCRECKHRFFVIVE